MNINTEYRSLSTEETGALVKNGCRCSNWENIFVKTGFDPGFYNNVVFSGINRLGIITKTPSQGQGPDSSFGIINATIHNCTVQDNVLVSDIGDYIADYIIEDDVVIRNCGRIHIEGSTSFGNGTTVAVLNETGKRGVKIWDRLSSHQAYIMALYRDRTIALRNIDKLIDEYTELVSSVTGSIGKGSEIIGSQHIKNVRFGPYSRIEGAALLSDGSVNSCKSDPVYIGAGVIMEHFIICSGSEVTDSALIDKCFIGQGCYLRKNFSAENSLFFANSIGYLGEASSVFAGPFTVTHHKSTLLLAGIYSFMNAGSGTNHSNHMYKLGPFHQGIMERGTKTTSGSYILWPARIGAFTLVSGRHYKNTDTSSLPFSYLIENKGESILVPAINLRSSGTLRDGQKWPQRDNRRDTNKLDHIIYDIFSPYTAGKMIRGRDLLIELKKSPGDKPEQYTYSFLTISRQSLERGIELYQTAIDNFLGSTLIRRLGSGEPESIEDLRNKLKTDSPTGRGEWTDMAGLLVPQSEKEKLVTGIERGDFNDLDSMNRSFETMYSSYTGWEWNWVAECIEKENGKSIEDFNASDVIKIVEKWMKSVADLGKMICEDAAREFTQSAMTGFGIDGDDEIRKMDFEQVRGRFETNSVVCALRDDMADKVVLGEKLINRLLLFKS